MSKPAFKLFGLQRTGTNLARRLMLDHFDVESIEQGTEWKHGWVRDPRRTSGGRPVIFIFCVKCPLAWLVSCYHYFQRAKGADRTVPKSFRRDLTLGRFIRLPVYGFPNSVYRWNVLNRHWLTYLPNCHVVRSEDMLTAEGQVEALEAIGRRFQLSPLSAFQAERRLIGVDMVPRGVLDAAAYTERRYLGEFSSADASWLANDCFWDDDLLARLKYNAPRFDPRRAFGAES